MEDQLAEFAKSLSLEQEAVAFLREHPVELQKAIIDGFDASGSKDGNVLGRLQSYTRHMAKRTVAMRTASDQGLENGSGASGTELRYPRSLFLSFRERLKSDPPVEMPQNLLKAVPAEVASGMGKPKATRSAMPTEAPPPPPPNPPSLAADIVGAPSSFAPTAPPKGLSAARPAALSMDTGSPRAKGSLNAAAAEFVPLSVQASPSSKQPRTPVSLAKTIAEPEQPMSPMRSLQQATLSSPSASQPPRTPVSLVATIPDESPKNLESLLSAPPASAAPPPQEAPALSRIKTAPAATPAAPSRDAAPPASGSLNPFEYHLHRLLFMIVAKRCNESTETPDNAAPKGVLVSSIPDEWTKVFGNDMSALMDKCGYKEVGVLVKAIDGLAVENDGDSARVVTTRSSFEGLPETSKSAADTGAVFPGRPPPPPPPAAPAPVLTPSGAKVLTLDTFVQSPSGKVPVGSVGTAGWPGAVGFPGTPSTHWRAMAGWDPMAASMSPWPSPLGAMGYPPPPLIDASSKVPEPPSTSAL